MGSQHQTIVIGAGIVGISTALSLQQAGQQVLLVDREPPGQATSFGNGGLFSTPLVVPMNNPGLWRQLPDILLRRNNYLRFDWPYLLRNAPILGGLLRHATETSYQARARVLRHLMDQSNRLHREWMAQAGKSSYLRDVGALELYPGADLFEATRRDRARLTDHGVDFQVLDSDQLKAKEPLLQGNISHGIWVKDAWSVDSPAALSEAYRALFIEQGGHFMQQQVERLESVSGEQGWRLKISGEQEIRAASVVVCLGPWSCEFLRPLGIRIPMIYEHGAHRVIEPGPAGLLQRPIVDLEGGFLLTPMQGRYRLTCGIYLAGLESKYHWEQLDASERIARQRLQLGPALRELDWQGTRPSMPDYLPVVGESARRGLWLNTGHGSLGLTVGPASAELLRDRMLGQKPEFHPALSVARF